MQGAQQAGEALQAGFDGGAPAPGGHALEAAVDRMQARAHALIPGVYTHAHRGHRVVRGRSDGCPSFITEEVCGMIMCDYTGQE